MREEDSLSDRSTEEVGYFVSQRDAAANAILIFPGDGEMATHSRALDWSATAVGAITEWPQSLRTTVSTMLRSRHPMFLWWGPDLVQFYNDAYRPSLGEGGRHPRALGMRGKDFWTEIWDIIGPQIDGVMTRGEPTWHENHLVPIERNGRIEEVYWTYGFSPVLDDEGRIGGTLVVCQETTSSVVADRQLRSLNRELEVERARLENVFRQAPAFLAVLRGPDHVFELVNNAYYQLVGHRDIVGKPLFEALPEVRGQGFEQRLSDVLATGTPFIGRRIPVRLERTPGAAPEQRFVDLVYMPLTDAEGNRIGVVAHGADVTDHVAARADVERLLLESEHERNAAQAASAEAEAANRTKSEFLTTMSHELRTPLNAIAGHVQLIEMGIHGPVSEAQRYALERVQRNQRHLLSLINDVLNFAKLEAGRVDYKLESLSLAQVVADVAPMIEPQLVRKGLAYKVDITPGVTVHADREKLQQILVNLLSNAIKFTGRGGSVTVDTPARGQADPELAFLRVSDTGIGIPREKLDSVFDAFVQIHRGLTSTTEGTGLGLSISRSLARAMRGDLRVRSEEGQGSAFTVALPRGDQTAARTLDDQPGLTSALGSSSIPQHLVSFGAASGSGQARVNDGEATP